MSNLEDWLDGDLLVGLEKDVHDRPTSQNGVHYTGIAYVLTGDRGYMEAVSDAFDTFGYHRNSVTNDKMSYDDLHVLVAYRKDVRCDFIRRLFWHPAKESWAIRWWFIRSPVFVVNVLFPFRKSIIRDLAIWLTGEFGPSDADAYKSAFLISELYPTREYAKKELRRMAFGRWPEMVPISFTKENVLAAEAINRAFPPGLVGAFAEYFPTGHPLISLSAEFESRRNGGT